MSRTIFEEGKRYGPHQTLLIKLLPKHVQPSGKKITRAIFECAFCGKNFESSAIEVNRGNTHSCGCYRKISKAKTHLKDLTGQHNDFKLTAIKRLEEQTSDNQYYWLCQCDCGQTIKVPTSEFKRIQSCGCACFISGGEEYIKKILDKNNITYIREHTFNDCRSKQNTLLRFDFYLPDYNCCIEIDGRQHFEPVSRFGGEKSFKILQENDKIKNQYCKNHSIYLIRIPYRNKIINKENLKEQLKKGGINIELE